MRAVNGNALAVAAAQGVSQAEKGIGLDSAIYSHSRQALRTISAESAANVFLARVRSGIADPDELAALVATQPDAVTLAAFCRRVQKVLEAQV